MPTRSSPDETADEPIVRLAQRDARWQLHRAARQRDVEALIARDGPAIRESEVGFLDKGRRIGLTAGARAPQPDEFWRNDKRGQNGSWEQTLSIREMLSQSYRTSREFAREPIINVVADLSSFQSRAARKFAMTQPSIMIFRTDEQEDSSFLEQRQG